MWTNVFKIGGLQQISWFQFLPYESDLSPLPEKSVKADQKDAATLLILSSHLQLQQEGLLSAWTNSFVGPWDPSQGMHNPDEKIKLWLFLPGRHSSVVEHAQAAVSRLRVVGTGLWLAPGDSEEVAAALSQALRNCIERSIRGLSYVRFGDVFSRCLPFLRAEKLFRRVQPTVEFVFAATEEAIFVHVIISAKHVRPLSCDDMESVLRHLSSNNTGERLPVIIAPHGMRGKLTGCCPSDLVKQVYFSKARASNGFTVLGLPSQAVQSSSCQLRGQNCHVEITLGCTGKGVALGKVGLKQGPGDHYPVLQRTFIYPAEAVLVPVMHTVFAKSSMKRIWVQNWVGTSLFGSSFFMHCLGLGSTGKMESLDGQGIDSSGIHTLHSNNSSSNSNSSSNNSISNTSSESDYRNTTRVSDLEADADSLTCRQFGLSSSDQLENDGLKLASKRPRTSMTDSFGQTGTVINETMQDPYKSEYNSIEVNNSATAGVANDQAGPLWVWDDEDRATGMDIQTLLSEFGDFGDFFENDALPFGEPPGTAESQALLFPVDGGDGSSSPCTMGIDVTDQMLLPALGFPSFEGFNQLPKDVTEEFNSKNQEIQSSGPGSNALAPSTGESDHLSKVEAMMIFAPEYRAIEASISELPSSIFRSPYLPRSRKENSSHSSSNVYVYGARPPCSPCLDVSDGKPSIAVNSETVPGGCEANSILNLKKYYTYVETEKEKLDRGSLACNNSIISSEVVTSSCEGVAPSFSGLTSTHAVKSVQRNKNGSMFEAGNFLLSSKTVLAADIECIMFQAAMCRMRHLLLSSTNLDSSGLGKFSGGVVSTHLPGDTSTVTDKFSSRYDVKKKEPIPIRIAGDVEGGMLDGPLNAPVGVWRSVGVPKGAKSASSPSTDGAPPMPHNSLNEEGTFVYGQKRPLQGLLDSMPLLVQQATSFVDVALDADYGDGPYGWLALEEQRRRGFSCGPSNIHAGCGGILASCHSLDIAGMELLDPLSANVNAASMLSLLQSDIKTALKSAFGKLDGPLSMLDWCKGRSQSSDTGSVANGYLVESTSSDLKDSSTVAVAAGEPVSPPQSSTVSSAGLKVSSATDGARVDENFQRRSNQEICGSESDQRLRPTPTVLPLPAILVGYQDDWLKTSANSLQLWEKAPLEPYALPKPMSYYVICPNIDPLTSAAADFFQQLGTVYEACKLGNHAPQTMEGQTELPSGRWLSSGFVIMDCPQTMKIESSNASFVGSISDYLLSLSNGWELTSFLKSLSKVLKSLKLSSSSTMSQKEGVADPCTVIYVVCPYPEPIAVLQTVVESSAAIGSIIHASDKERRSMLHTQVGKALSCSTAVDEASTSNVPTISGFSIPKLVLQIITVDAIFRVTSPALHELVLLKEIAFTVYNKARRISRVSCSDLGQSLGISGRPQSTLMHIASPVPGMWKDSVTRITGPSLPRDNELDSGLRPGTWDNSWQTSRTGGINCDPNRSGDILLQDDTRYLFEPLFILAEPGSVEHGISPTMSGSVALESSRPADDNGGGSFMQNTSSLGSSDIGSGSLLDGSDPGVLGSSYQKAPSLHCCYGWTEDWRWLISIWTDSRGELLDSHIFPFGGISSRQDTKGLQCLFVQVLQQGCQILSCSPPEIAPAKTRDIVITRIGCFYELECQEWQKAIYTVGGNEVKKWLQLRGSVSDGIPGSSNGTSLQQQEMGLIQERALPSSPSPSLYSPHTKSSGFIKGGIVQNSTRKQLMGGQTTVDSSRGLFQWVQSISLIGVCIDHSLQLAFQPDAPFPGGGTQGGSGNAPSVYLEGFSSIKSVGSVSASYIITPSPSMRFLLPMPLQLPTCLTAESPPLAHLLHSKGSAIPLRTGFVVSKAASSIRKDSRSNAKEEWPSVLSVSLVDYYGTSNITQEKIVRGSGTQARTIDNKDGELETHLILESVAAELHSLSWMTVSPAYLERRTALPFHCDMLLRLRRLLHYADKELTQQRETLQV